ncbi:MAG: TraB/GumN family protein [Cyanobacteria bacterium SZAS LIN-3]|nr:TraB/GumN family protein [Cyanobacteria bacterium SZAS LIN-3]
MKRKPKLSALSVAALLASILQSTALAQVLDSSVQPTHYTGGQAPPTDAAATPPPPEAKAAPPAEPAKPVPASEVATATTPEGKPICLWCCKKGARTIYLLGTIHVARSGFYPLPEEMEKALTESKILFVEADVLQLSREKMIEALKKLGLYTPPDCLSKNLSASARDALNQYVDWSGETLSMYEPYKPWVVGQLLTSSNTRKAGYKADLGIDRHLLQEAHATSKKIIPLETVESQLGVISSFDKNTQEKLLLGDIVAVRNAKGQMEKIESLWSKGDADSLYSIGLDGETRDSALDTAREALLDKRNQEMLQVLSKNLPEHGTVLVAVGAAHLGGKQGLVAKLSAQGYSIEQVKSLTQRKNQTISFGGSNMKRMFYPEGMLRVSLPGEPEVKYETVNNIRMVDYSYPTFAGQLCLSYIILPGVISDPARQAAFLQTIAASIVSKMHGSNVSLSAVSGGAMPTMYVTCKLPAKVSLTNQDLFFRSRMMLSGRRMYLIGGQGTADFFKSKQFSQFDGSLEIVPENGLAKSTPSSFSSPFSSSSSTRPTSRTTNFPSSATAGRRPGELTDLQRKVRNDFERVRQQMENSRYPAH